MIDLKHSITLVVGDWSGDGHEKTEKISVVCSHSSKELEEAYNKGTEKLGFNFTQTVAVEYEDNKLYAKEIKLLRANGIDMEFEDGEDENGNVCLMVDDFWNLYLAICKLGNPKIEYKEGKQKQKINIGGYGLFWG